MLAREPGVEYGGQFVDWSLADHEDVRKRESFWQTYDKARTIRGPLDVFRFIQHDHVMRRPVRLLTRHVRALFEVRPLAVRVGPILRYVDRQRALIWFELETPDSCASLLGRPRINASCRSTTCQRPRASAMQPACGWVAGITRLICLEGPEPDSVDPYSVTLAPQPPTGRLPIDQRDFTGDSVSGFATIRWWSERRSPGGCVQILAVAVLPHVSRFVRHLQVRPRLVPQVAGRQGVPPVVDVGKECRRWAGDPNDKILEPSPDMLEALCEWLPGKKWADWPRFFLHTGDQIYADDVGVAIGGAIVRHRFAAVVPGPLGTGASDIAFGAWAGRFGARYGPLGAAAAPTPVQLDTLCAMRPRVTHHNFHDIDYALTLAVRSRKQAAFARTRPPLPVPLKLRVLNHLLWEYPMKPSRCHRSARAPA